MECCPFCKDDSWLFIVTGNQWECKNCAAAGEVGEKMFAKPYFVKRPILNSNSPIPAYSPSLVASFYQFPKIKSGTVPTVALIELSGGYSLAQIGQWCQRLGYPNPNITDVYVDGARNNFTNNPQSADVEVALDICCVIGAIYYSTGQPANILMVFAPNSSQGFIDAVRTVANRTNIAACGISWGAAERNWSASAMQAMDAAFVSLIPLNQPTFCCAAGDNGSSDGAPGNNVDYPGSSPYVVCCGGTSIVTQGGGITNEVPWNHDGGATGGGFSAVEDIPLWQQGFLPNGVTKRGVPDLTAFADPSPGWDTPFGAVGGTSAVAPFMAAYFALLKMQTGVSTGLVNSFLYKNEPCFRDLVVGNNGTQSAGKGWDSTTGLGAPIGESLKDAWVKYVSTPPVPPPVIPPPIITPGPSLANITAAVNAYFANLLRLNPDKFYQNLLPQIDAGVDKAIVKLFAASNFLPDVGGMSVQEFRM